MMGYDQKISFGRDAHARLAPSQSGTSFDQAAVEQIVKSLIEERRKRCSYFPHDLFADPAWDILLVLALFEARQQRLTVSRLCDAVDVPATTALRWVQSLTDRGLLVRRDDVHDKRRKYIKLSAEAYAAMVAYCSTAQTRFSLAA